MIAGSYVLHLYCDGPEHERHDYAYRSRVEPGHFGRDCETGSAARAQARKCGWRLNLQEGTALCPRCAATTQKRKAK